MRGTAAQKHEQTERARDAVKAYPDGTYGVCLVIRQNPTLGNALEVETALVARDGSMIDKDTILWALSHVLDALMDLPPDEPPAQRG